MIEGIRITVELGDDGRPVVVKTADHDEADLWLSREAERLARARHPGVIEIVDRANRRLVLAWAGHHTLDTLSPTPEVAVTLVANLAATLCDLHALGIVHGRLTPGHVVVDDRGRPRLCGLRGAGPGPIEPGPAEDVAALGRLIDLLLGTEAELEPIPEHRWGRKRWSGAQRRALLTLADQASDPDPARRPTARALAAAVAQLVPEAQYATPSPPRDGPKPSAEEPSTEERPVPPESAADDLPVRDEESGQETEGAGDDPDLSLDDRAHDGVPIPARTIGGERFLGLRLEDRSRGPGLVDPVAPEPAPAEPGSPRVGEPTNRPRWASRPVLLALGTVGGALVVIVALSSSGSRTHPPHTAAVPLTGVTTTSIRPPDDPPRCPGQDCPTDGEIVGNLIRRGDHWFEAGRSGDHVSLGDWDCDGVDTPAVVRPSTGEVFVFDHWATPRKPTTVAPVAVVPKAMSLETVTTASGCAPPRVRLADGSVESLPSVGRPR